MADKAIDDLGRDQMEFAEEVLILFENKFFFFKKKGKNVFTFCSIFLLFLPCKFVLYSTFPEKSKYQLI